MQRALGVLKATAGNDKAKATIGVNNGIELIIAGIGKHPLSTGIADVGCSTIATVSLKQPENCTRVVQAGGPEVILKAMQLHPTSEGVQVGDSQLW